jgi:predicted phage-related endonuclease
MKMTPEALAISGQLRDMLARNSASERRATAEDMDRIGFIGASDFGALLGLSKFKTPHQLWLEKTGQAPPFPGNLYTDVGTALEPLVLKLAVKRLGLTELIRASELTPEGEPWLKVHLDATARRDGELVVMESKTCSFSKRDGGWGPEGGELVPSEYWAQVTMQMHAARLCGLPVSKAIVACLFLNRLGDGPEKQPQIFEVPYDEGTAHRMMEKGRAFFKLVQSRTWQEAA